ncbi:MAG TPA: efflux transporter outer membrane subunit [Gammaproteobacteria bacterium]|nr:efflux transporter outer membrane subunit [Gammaproteobacteria bacterium]
MNRTIHRAARLALLSLFVAFAAGCARTPVPEIMPTDVPADWQGPVQSDAELWPNTDWWNNFESEELTAIIELVKANNFDYANNLRNLEAAQIQLRGAGFELWPTPNVSIGTGASTSETRFGDGSSTSGSSSGPIDLVASVSYGGILSKPLDYERSVNDYESQLAQVASTALNTMGTAASTYLQLLFIRDQIEVTRVNLDNATQILDFTRARVDAGVEIPINLLNQQISVQSIQNDLTSQIQQDFQVRAALALLIGRGVQGFDVEGQTLEGIAVPTVQPGLPSELLTRRPDLVQAELNLESAAINVDLARRAFFPSISLNGSASASSPALVDILADPATTTVALSASLAQTLLDNGGRRRNVEQARLSLETALANYRRSIIEAFNDIEVQLNNIQLIQDQGLVIQQQLAAAEEQFRLAELRYEQGVANFQTVLNAQLQLFSTRNSVLQNRLQQLNAIIGFYQSLGGGWEAGEILVETPEYASAR